MARPRSCVRSACFGALLIAVAASAGADVLLYKGKHRQVEELLPIAQTLLSDAGRARVDARTNSLLLVGDAALLAEVERVLVAQDRAPRTVLLRYAEKRVSELGAQGFQIRWSFEGDGYRVGSARPPAGAGSRVAIGVEDSRAERVGDFAGTLRVLEGSTGRIQTGSAAPITLPTRRGPVTAWSSAVSGFEARPRILGDGRVHLELAPFDARLSRGAVEHAGASTTLVVSPGGHVVVGGLARETSDSAASPLSGASAARAADERVLVIRVDVEKPGSVPAAAQDAPTAPR